MMLLDTLEMLLHALEMLLHENDGEFVTDEEIMGSC